MGIACVCMPATAGFFNRGNCGQRIVSGLSQVFGFHSLRSKYGKNTPVIKSKESSFRSKLSGNKRSNNTVAKTYITIDRDDSSMQGLNSLELDNYSRV
jgi:hypothetical protein